MATQTLKKICSVLVIAMLFEVIFMAQTSHSSSLDVCLKHCVQNQCLNTVKDATDAVCETACKKMCNEQQISGQKYFIAPKSKGPKTGVCRFITGFGC